jgi:NADPH-dependent 2,4-dienoyl-CoA reductase/sulfur reductase-like enzyme
MSASRVVIVGAGPAGVRAAEAFVAAGLRPVAIDEGDAAGGQIYRRAPAGFARSYRTLYGFEAAKARRLHDAFAALTDRIDHRPGTLAWNVWDRVVHTVRDGVVGEVPYDALVICSGAMDRVIPLPGWTLPGVFTLGGAQVALKAQGCTVGRRVAFLGTGPLLYLVAYQYLKAGAEVAAVLDTSPFDARVRAVPGLLALPAMLAKGLWTQARLQAGGVRIETGVRPLEVTGDGAVAGLAYADRAGTRHALACDAVALGYGLKPETQLAELAGCRLAYDAPQDLWLPERDALGRAGNGVYLAGDGARIGGADAAEGAGRLAALACLGDLGHRIDGAEVLRLRKRLRRQARFRLALEAAFPFPAHLAASLPDEVVLCRCEGVTAGDVRAAGRDKEAAEINRAKALSRVGMGRCQGRVCGAAARHVLAAALGRPVEAMGQLRAQAPVKPLALSAAASAVPEPTL